MLCIKCKKEIPDDSVFCNWCGKKQTAEKRKALKRANGMGSVYNVGARRRKPWLAQKGGKHVGYFATKTEALAALEKLQGQKIDDTYNATFESVYNSWKSEHFRSLTAKGVEGYENAYNIFKPLHDKKMRGLKTQDYQQIIDAQHAKGRSASTCNKYKQLIGQMSKWAMREDIIDKNYAQFIKIEQSESKEKEIFTDEEIKKIKADTSETAKIVMMLIGTGMRISELFELPLADYHENYCIGGVKTKAGKNRLIPIVPAARPYFKYFAGIAQNTILDGYSGNKEVRNFRVRDYAQLLKKLGIPYKSPHSTRHTFASLAVKSGMRPETLQKIIGHASYTTTADIYVHADSDELVLATSSIKL